RDLLVISRIAAGAWNCRTCPGQAATCAGTYPSHLTRCGRDDDKLTWWGLEESVYETRLISPSYSMSNAQLFTTRQRLFHRAERAPIGITSFPFHLRV